MKTLLALTLLALPVQAADKAPVKVAVIGGMTLGGMWPELAEKFTKDTGWPVELVTTGPKAVLCEGLEDTITLANSDNYLGDLAFYQNVQAAAKRGVTGADTILNDLKSRFPGRPKGTPPTPK